MTKIAISFLLLLLFTACSSSEVTHEQPPADPIAAVLYSHRKDFRSCYLKGTEGISPQPSGIVKTYFIIEVDGSVRMASIKSTTLHNAPTESCVLDVIRTIQFPASKTGNMVRVDYPFKFTAKK